MSQPANDRFPRWLTAIFMFVISFVLVILTYFIDIVGALYYFITILIAFLLWTYVDKQPIEGVGFNRTSLWWLQLILGIILTSTVLGLIIWLEVLIGWLILTPVFLSVPLWTSAGLLAYYAIWQALVAAAEEFVNRGYIQQNLAARLPMHLAILAASILFAALHIPSILFHLLPLPLAIIMFMNLILGGIMLGLAFTRTGHLWLPIGLHFGWNYMLYHIAGFGGNGIFEAQNLGLSLLTGGSMGPEAGLLGTAAFLFLIAIIWLGTQSSRGQLMRSFERKPLLMFVFGFLVIAIPVVLGMIFAGLWLFLALWILYSIFFLQIWENRILCSHCPHYAAEGRTLRCHANYGIYKLWTYNPAPISRSEQAQIVIGVVIMIGFPFPFLVWAQQWLMLNIALFGVIILGTILFGWLCLRCINFSCPFNRVPKNEVDTFLKEHPKMLKAWEKKGHELG
ncbi:MAG: lysostaphin resistance A-like protein [Promethearchaeota archaeon]